MQRGTVIAERFEVEGVAGHGGMGVVYRAVDLSTQQTVALKVLHALVGGESGNARFEREAQLLATLEHGGFVRHIAHGWLADGRGYLAMDWLEGEDLATRLRRGPLGVEESQRLVTRAAEALGVAHSRGIVHRDIKPSNLFLTADGDIKVIDFGIARTATVALDMTRTGMILGTPGYLAPEQARRGARALDARADVFALGCVLFECLTGQPAFSGDNPLAILSRVLLEEVPAVSTLRADVPPALDVLLSQMLDKDPDNRPPNGAEVVAAMERVLRASQAFMAQVAQGRDTTQPLTALTNTEQRLLCVLLVSNGFGFAATQVVTAVSTTDEGHSIGTPESLIHVRLQGEVARFRGQLHVLVDGSMLATFEGTGLATDQAVLAARCALGLREILPEASMALVMGRVALSQRLPVGEVIDRAISLLQRARRVERKGVWVEEALSKLLAQRFDIQHIPPTQTDPSVRVQADGPVGGVLEGEGVLVAERGRLMRTLLGKPSPYVGRERELMILESAWRSCVEDEMARAVLVTAHAGMGKSRLTEELLRRVHAADEGPALLLLAQGDTLRAGSAYGLIAPALRAHCGFREDDSPALKRKHVKERLGRHLDGGDEAGRVLLFLGELLGVAAEDMGEGDACAAAALQLRAARQDAQIMGDQIQRAFEAWLVAETRQGPALLVMEDLHWGDLPTTRLIDGALRACAQQPLMVLALARPEVHEVFATLWAERQVEEVKLTELPRKAAARLVQRALGERVGEATIQRIIEQAGGNAFHLEELVRAAAAGRLEALPETALALASARLEALPAPARRILRAASVFGLHFWRGGVGVLIGEVLLSGESEDSLTLLRAQEVVEPDAQGSQPRNGEPAWKFRHALLREAAYAMLTDADRRLGHLLAGQWLERAGEQDPMTLAEHYHRGASPPDAARWFLVASQQALEGDDLPRVVSCAERGINSGAQGETLGHLHKILAEALNWQGVFHRAEHHGLLALDLLPPDSDLWARAAAEVLVASGRISNRAVIVPTTERVLERLSIHDPSHPNHDPTNPHPNPQLLIALMRAQPWILRMGEDPIFQKTLRTIYRHNAFIESDPLVASWARMIRTGQWFIKGNVSAFIRDLQAAIDLFERSGDRRNACAQRSDLPLLYVRVGHFALGEQLARQTLEETAILRLNRLRGVAFASLSAALQRLDRIPEAIEVAQQGLAEVRSRNDWQQESMINRQLAEAFITTHRFDEAESILHTILGMPNQNGFISVQCWFLLSLLRLQQGRFEESISFAEQAIHGPGALWNGDLRPRMFLILALSLLALSRTTDAQTTLAQAYAALIDTCQRVDDPSWHALYTYKNPEHLELFDLMRLHNIPFDPPLPPPPE